MVRWMQAHRRLLIVGIILAFCSAKTQGEVKLKPCFATEKTVLPSPFLKPKLKIFWGYWTTHELTTSVAAIILSEKLGFDVELVSDTTARASMQAIAKGDIHINFEFWPGSNPDTYREYAKEFHPDVEPGQVHAFPYKSLFARSGLYETCSRHSSTEFRTCLDGSLSNSQVLLKEAMDDPAIQRHFSQEKVAMPEHGSWNDAPRCQHRGTNCSVEILHIAPTGYDEGLLESIVTTLNLPASIAYLGEEAHTKAIWKAYTAKKGALVYSYFPNALQDGVAVQGMPRAAMDQDLDFPTQQLVKIAWPGLEKERGGDALAFVRDFHLSLEDYNRLAETYEIVNDTQKAACVWLVDNPELWQPLIKFPERKQQDLLCLQDDSGMCNLQFRVGWVVFTAQVLLFAATLYMAVSLKQPRKYHEEEEIRRRIKQVLAGNSPPPMRRTNSALYEWWAQRTGGYRTRVEYKDDLFLNVPRVLTHKRSLDVFCRSNVDADVIFPPEGGKDRWISALRRSSLYPYLFLSAGDGMKPVLLFCVSFGLFSGAVSTGFWLVVFWETYKRDAKAFAEGYAFTGEGSYFKAIERSAAAFASLIDAFKFFPSFLLLGFVGYAVNRWRAFQDAGYNLVGAINSLALIIGSSLTDLDNHAGLQLAFRVYRYLTLVHVLNYKEQHRWFRELSMDDFLALGLLTADELPILQPLDLSGQREVVVSWISREMFFGVKNDLLTSKLKCTLATSIRSSVGTFQAMFLQNQPNLWAALMKIVCDLLILFFVVGTAFQSFMYELRYLQVYVVFFTICQTVPWLCASAMVATLANPYSAEHDMFNADAIVAACERVTFHNLRTILNFPNHDYHVAERSFSQRARGSKHASLPQRLQALTVGLDDHGTSPTVDRAQKSARSSESARKLLGFRTSWANIHASIELDNAGQDAEHVQQSDEGHTGVEAQLEPATLALAPENGWLAGETVLNDDVFSAGGSRVASACSDEEPPSAPRRRRGSVGLERRFLGGDDSGAAAQSPGAGGSSAGGGDAQVRKRLMGNRRVSGGEQRVGGGLGVDPGGSACRSGTSDLRIENAFDAASVSSAAISMLPRSEPQIFYAPPYLAEGESGEGEMESEAMMDTSETPRGAYFE